MLVFKKMCIRTKKCVYMKMYKNVHTYSGLVQNVRKVKLLNINILHPSDTHTHYLRLVAWKSYYRTIKINWFWGNKIGKYKYLATWGLMQTCSSQHLLCLKSRMDKHQSNQNNIWSCLKLITNTPERCQWF